MKRTDIFICLVLLLLSIIPRLILLDKIPQGIHGDEGWTVIDTRKILKNGYIEPYVGSALGQPTGPLYITALVFKIFGESIFWLRFSMAIFSIATIVILYIFLRLHFDLKIASLTTLSFSFSLFHIHYSRIAFMLISAPFFQLLTLIFLTLSLKLKKHKTFFIICSAVVMGLGIFSYNAFLVFPITVIVYLIISLFIDKKSGFKIKHVILFLTFFLFTALPLLKFIINNPDFYFAHYKTYSIFNRDDVKKETQFMNKTYLIARNGINNSLFFFKGKKMDFVDGFGKYYSFTKFQLLTFTGGLIIVLIKRRAFDLFMFSSFIVLFFVAAFSTFDAIYRRQILSLVYLFFFMAIFLNWIFNTYSKKYKNKIIILVFLIILFESYININTYFTKFANDPEAKWVFTSDLTKTLISLDGKYQNIILYSRWFCNYETLNYLAPKIKCINGKDKSNYQSVSNGNTSAAVFIGKDYFNLLDNFKSDQPYGKEYFITDDNGDKISLIYEF